MCNYAIEKLQIHVVFVRVRESRQGKWERKRGGWKLTRSVHISTASRTIFKIYHDLTLCVPGELIAQAWLTSLD